MGKNRIYILLDESGSMQSRFSDVIGGVQGFLKAQSLAPDMLVTLAAFNDNNRVNPEYVYTDRPISECSFTESDFSPSGGTPLLDAVGNLVRDAKCGRNGKTLIAIFTDGEENASRTWNKHSVKALIESKDPKKWQFMYLGVGIDNFDDARSMGVSYGTTRTYTTFTSAVASASSGATQDWYAQADSSSIELPESDATLTTNVTP